MKKFSVLLVLCLFSLGCGEVNSPSPEGNMNLLEYRIDRFTGGLNLKQDPNIIPGGIQPEQALEAINVDFRDGVSIQSRDGFIKLINNTYAKNVVGLYPFYVGAIRHMMVLTWDGSAYALFDSTTSKKTGTASAIYFNPSSYNDLCYIPHAGNSDSEDYNLKYDGSTITRSGIDAPADKCSGAVGSAASGLFGGTSDHGKLFKWNNSSAWEEKAAQLGSVTKIYCLIEYNNKIYAGTDRGTLLEWDSSSAWVEVASQLTDTSIRGLCILGGYLYGSGVGGVLQKWDGAGAWTSVAPQSGSENIYSLCVYNSGAGDHIYGGTSENQKLLEFNGTDAWVVKAPSLTGLGHVYALVVYDSGSGNHLYGATENDGLWEWNNTNAWVSKSASLSLYAIVVYNSGSGNHLYAAGNNGNLYEWNNVSTLTSVAPGGTASVLALGVHNSYLYAGTLEGKLLKWNKSNAWVEVAPAYGGEITIWALISFTPPSNLNGTYQYFYSYVNSTTGQESALSPVSDAIVATDDLINLSNIDASTDTQVDKKHIYRTGGTLSTINYLGEIVNATTTYEDNIADMAIGDLEDCSHNDVLPAVRFFSIHHHQLFAGYSDTDKGTVFDSRFYQPESCPDLYFFKVGNESDYVVAVMPLDIDMIVYTRLHTFRLRYIGMSEGDVIMEEIAPIGLVSDNTLVTCVDDAGRPFHLFLGQSAKGRGIYRHNGSGVSLISRIVDPIFTGERPDVIAMDWTYINTCAAAFCKNKYYLAYPETGQTTPNKVLVADFDFSPNPAFLRHDFKASAICYDPNTDELIFGGTNKEVYKLSGTSDWISGAAAGITMVYQTPYIGNRNQYEQMREILFSADTQGNALTVKVYTDHTLKQTLTCSTASMQRVKLSVNPALCIGKCFSIRFEITSTSRVKISPPLEVRMIPKSN